MHAQPQVEFYAYKFNNQNNNFNCNNADTQCNDHIQTDLIPNKNDNQIITLECVSPKSVSNESTCNSSNDKVDCYINNPSDLNNDNRLESD